MISAPESTPSRAATTPAAVNIPRAIASAAIINHRDDSIGRNLTTLVKVYRSSASRRSWSARLGTTKDARKIGSKLFPVHRKATVWLSATSKV